MMVHSGHNTVQAQLKVQSKRGEYSSTCLPACIHLHTYISTRTPTTLWWCIGTTTLCRHSSKSRVNEVSLTRLHAYIFTRTPPHIHLYTYTSSCTFSPCTPTTVWWCIAATTLQARLKLQYKRGESVTYSSTCPPSCLHLHTYIMYIFHTYTNDCVQVHSGHNVVQPQLEVSFKRGESVRRQDGKPYHNITPLTWDEITRKLHILNPFFMLISPPKS